MIGILDYGIRAKSLIITAHGTIVAKAAAITTTIAAVNVTEVADVAAHTTSTITVHVVAAN